MALFWLSGEAWKAVEPHLPQNHLVRDGSMIGGSSPVSCTF